MAENILDRAIGWISPAAGLRRVRRRKAIEVMRSYDGASRDRFTHSWRTHNTSGDAEVAGAGTLLRDRMRDLVRNNPYASNAIEALVTHAVGAGIVPRTKDKKVNALFEEWSRKCDASGHLDFYGLQALVVREMLVSGDGIVRRRGRLAKDGLPVPLQLQVLEIDQVDVTKSGPLPNGGKVTQGIETWLDKVTGYWMYPEHPGNATSFDAMRSTLVGAEEIAHVFKKDRMQLRGVPWGHAAVRSIRDLDGYEQAEIVRKKTEACLVGVVTGGGPDDPTMGIPLDKDQKPGLYSVRGNPVEQMTPGTVYHTRGGTDIKFTQPALAPNYDQYKTSMLHTIAAGFHVPHSLVSGRLDKVNYSSSKVGLESFKRVIDTLQWQFIIPMLLDPIWDWFCEYAYAAGKIKQRYVPVVWQPPKFPSADESKDIAATVRAIRAGLKSPMQAITETGYTPDEVLAEFVEWNKRLDSAGLVFDSDPRRMSQAGQTQLPVDDPPENKVNNDDDT